MFLVLASIPCTVKQKLLPKYMKSVGKEEASGIIFRDKSKYGTSNSSFSYSLYCAGGSIIQGASNPELSCAKHILQLPDQNAIIFSCYTKRIPGRLFREFCKIQWINYHQTLRHRQTFSHITLSSDLGFNKSSLGLNGFRNDSKRDYVWVNEFSLK